VASEVSETGGTPSQGCVSGGGGLRLLALDLDGVVYRGDVVLPGVREALAEALCRGLDIRYVSNNSTAHRETVSARLAAMGLPAGTERVLTSGFVTGRWLKERLPVGASVLVVGEAGLVRELAEAGFDPIRAGEGAVGGVGAVVVGLDRGLTYAGLKDALSAIDHGALFVATNEDATVPTPEGLAPGAGAIVAAVKTMTRSEPILVGKPGAALAWALAGTTGVPPAETLMVGDRLDTDVAMGAAAGMITALVLTGVTTEAELERVRSERGADVVAGAAGAESVGGADAVGGAAESAESGGTLRVPDHVLADMTELPALLDLLGA